MKRIALLLIPALGFTLSTKAQFNLNNAVNTVTGAINNNANTGNLTNDQVIKGLKEALTVGTKNSSEKASKADGFFKNPAIKIPFPQQAIKMKNTLEAVGLKPQVDQFVMTLNRAAEEAAKDAAPIFMNAITSMSIGDGFTILKGADNAATNYLKDKTSKELHAKFKPSVKKATQKVQVTKYWNPLMTRYNKVPGVQKQNPDLDEYVTQKAMEGMFKLIADEEMKIRKDPGARINDILKQVFGKP